MKITEIYENKLFSITLTDKQREIVKKILGLEFSDDGEYTHFSDEQLQEICNMNFNPLNEKSEGDRSFTIKSIEQMENEIRITILIENHEILVYHILVNSQTYTVISSDIPDIFRMYETAVQHEVFLHKEEEPFEDSTFRWYSDKIKF